MKNGCVIYPVEGKASSTHKMNMPAQRLKIHGYYLLLADAASLSVMPLISSVVLYNSGALLKCAAFWGIVSIATILLVSSHGGYKETPRYLAQRRSLEAACCYLAISLTMLSGAGLLGHTRLLMSNWTLINVLGTAFVMLCGRWSVLQIYTLAKPKPSPSTLIVCYDHCPRDLPQALEVNTLAPTVMGILYLCPFHEAGDWLPWPELADNAVLAKQLSAYHVKDVVFVHHPELDSFASNSQQALFLDLITYPTRIWMAFDLAANVPAALRHRAPACQLIPVATNELLTSHNPSKRLFDIVLASFLLILSTPLLFFCAALVRLSGPGPLIFRQTRTGAHGQKFTVLKFRTMADAAQPGFIQARPDDPRVTRIGSLLRRTSLDELLQLVNVIRGDMSLVGPRPHAPETSVSGVNFEQALNVYRLRHRVKPGITGLAQVRGHRGETRTLKGLEQRVESDLEYIKRWSLWFDLLILIRTIPAVLTQRNAY